MRPRSKCAWQLPRLASGWKPCLDVLEIASVFRQLCTFLPLDFRASTSKTNAVIRRVPGHSLDRTVASWRSKLCPSLT